MLGKTTSMRVSETVFNILDLEYGEELFGKYNLNLENYLDTFNNCRETGYVLTIMDDYSKENKKYKRDLFIWAFQNRNSDDIVVIISDSADRPNLYNMFSDNSYLNKRQLFKYDKYYEAASYIRDKIIEHFCSEEKSEEKVYKYCII